jgi:serine protease Do
MKPKDKAASGVGSGPAFSVSSRKDEQAWNVRIPKVRFLKPPAVNMGNTQRLRAGMVAGLMLLALGFGFLGGWAGARAGNGDSGSAKLSNSLKVVTSQSQLINDIAKTVGPSVVSVDVVGTSDSGAAGGFYDYFGGGSGGGQQTESAGTGIILSSDGLIMTNRHVVPSGTTQVSVTLSDGTQLDSVEVLGRTNDNDSLDVAFLKISDTKGHKLTPATIGNSSKVQVGDAVVAIGNALGQFQNTVTSGIVSGFGRSVQAGDSSGDSSSTENLDDLFQTDAAINEGNSGGPLVNMNGQVVGINTAIASDSQNIGFAIPINDVSGLIKQVKDTGKFQRPYLGVRYVPLTVDIAKQYDLSVNEGAFILPSTDPANPSIVAGSPADKAGLQPNDVIVKADKVHIDAQHSLTSVIDQHSVGDSLQLQVLRDGKTINVNATLEAAPSQ